jgi:hypothetical protein
MESSRDAKIAGWAGILFVLLSGVIAVVSPFWPPLGATAAEVVAYYPAHRLPFLVGNYLAIAAVVPGFVELAYLTALFRRAEGEKGWLWILVLGTGVAAHALGSAVLITYQVVPFETGPGLEAVAKGLNDLAGAGFALFLLGLLAYVLAASWATYATRALPRWYGHLGIPVAILSLVASLGAIWTPPGLAGGGLASCVAVSAFFGWCLVLAVLFLRRPVGAVS